MLSRIATASPHSRSRSGRIGRRTALFAGLLSGGLLCSPKEAAADVSTWAAVAGGAGSLRSPTEPGAFRGFTQFEAGVGTTPASSVVVGGLFKTLTFFGFGTDIAWTARAATGGFARGDWGLAFDAGPFYRLWGPAQSTGLLASLTVGGPWGFQGSALFQQGESDSRVVGVVLGFDFMRMSVYRTAGTTWLPNPLPPAELRALGPGRIRF